MSEKLLPCPFCGGEAIIRNTFITISDKDAFWVECRICDIGTKYDQVEQNAINLWNARASAWQSVSEGLPEECTSVMFTFADGAVETGHINGERVYTQHRQLLLKDVAAWAPKPEPSKNDK